MIIDIRKLLAANVFSSTEQTRYYLGGVLFEVKEGKGRFVATDGHRMIIIPLDGDMGPDLSVIIPSTLIKRIKVDKKVDNAEMTIDGDIITIDYYGSITKEAAIDGTFPDYTRVGPKDGEEKDTGVIGFNPSYLGDFAKVNKIMGAGKGNIKMTMYGEEIAVKITCLELDYTAFLMPIRIK
jgi:DNA polymerase III sliding clamp (beta) subunit (PCNA family)